MRRLSARHHECGQLMNCRLWRRLTMPPWSRRKSSGCRSTKTARLVVTKSYSDLSTDLRSPALRAGAEQLAPELEQRPTGGQHDDTRQSQMRLQGKDARGCAEQAEDIERRQQRISDHDVTAVACPAAAQREQRRGDHGEREGIGEDHVVEQFLERSEQEGR